MKTLDRISLWLNQVMKFLAGFLAAAMTILVFLQVLFRYALDAPLDWSEETASFAFVWMGLLGASIGLQSNEHPSLDLLFVRMPRVLQKITLFLTYACMIFVLVVLLVYGLKLTLSMRFQLTAALQYSVGYMYMVLPLSALIMCFHAAVKIIRIFAPEHPEKK